jgi:nicotinamide mononucleotide transporter
MLDWLASAVTAFGLSTTPGELLGFATGLLCVYLLVRQNVLNWPIGIANVVLLFVVFWHVGLYGDAWLQVVYVVLGLFGWWSWHHRTPAGDVLAVRRTAPAEWIGLTAAGAVGFVALWLFLDRATGSTVPVADALTTVLSLLATFGGARKLIESWWIWIAADLIYIPLYAHKGLWLTSILYIAFLCLCITGLRTWRRDLARDAPLVSA